jgi:hypothetical protein
MNPKTAFRQAWSILRYDPYTDFYNNDYACRRYDTRRDPSQEIRNVPSRFLGAAVKCQIMADVRGRYDIGGAWAVMFANAKYDADKRLRRRRREIDIERKRQRKTEIEAMRRIIDRCVRLADVMRDCGDEDVQLFLRISKEADEK